MRSILSFQALSLAALLAIGASLPGCSGAESESDEAEVGHTAEYVVRGRVTQLPSPDSPAAEFQVHHEPIPNFRATWPDGALGMNSMIMPFPLGEGVSLDEIEVGDVVELTFEVDYAPETGAVQTYRVVEVSELPSETELIFGRAREDAASEDAASEGG